MFLKCRWLLPLVTEHILFYCWPLADTSSAGTSGITQLRLILSLVCGCALGPPDLFLQSSPRKEPSEWPWKSSKKTGRRYVLLCLLWALPSCSFILLRPVETGCAVGQCPESRFASEKTRGEVTCSAPLPRGGSLGAHVRKMSPEATCSLDALILSADTPLSWWPAVRTGVEPGRCSGAIQWPPSSRSMCSLRMWKNRCVILGWWVYSLEGSVSSMSWERRLWGLWRWFFPGGSDGKVSVYDAGDPGSIPGSGRSPGEGNGSPLQYYCLENPMDWRAW